MDPNKFTEKTIEALNAAQEQAVEHNHQQARAARRSACQPLVSAVQQEGATGLVEQCVLLGD